MIGNDVVDLGEPEARPGARHPRFDRRVFAPAEREALAASAVPERLRWMLWAAKEAAFKAARQARPALAFSPVRQLVALSEGWPRAVRVGECALPVHVEADVDRVHAVAWGPGDGRPGTRWGVRGVAELGRSLAPGEAARALALEALAELLGVEPGALSIVREGRVPRARVGDRPAPVDLSLSHHGRFVAFACAPRPGAPA